ncbi:hypothetical protein TWF696_007209 [Orbilia brochopaga]|uniref:Uncharacterized protein n=1 Tax=Orbilia brochopaga TaxID=3140254 RepID=A0AAV9UTR5_9PEZI
MSAAWSKPSLPGKDAPCSNDESTSQNSALTPPELDTNTAQYRATGTSMTSSGGSELLGSQANGNLNSSEAPRRRYKYSATGLIRRRPPLDVTEGLQPTGFPKHQLSQSPASEFATTEPATNPLLDNLDTSARIDAVLEANMHKMLRNSQTLAKNQAVLQDYDQWINTGRQPSMPQTMHSTGAMGAIVHHANRELIDKCIASSDQALYSSNRAYRYCMRTTSYNSPNITANDPASPDLPPLDEELMGSDEQWIWEEVEEPDDSDEDEGEEEEQVAAAEAGRELLARANRLARQKMTTAHMEEEDSDSDRNEMRL